MKISITALTIWEVSRNSKSNVKRGDCQYRLDEVGSELVADLEYKMLLRLECDFDVDSSSKDSGNISIQDQLSDLRCERLLQGENHAGALEAVDGDGEVEGKSLQGKLAWVHLHWLVRVYIIMEIPIFTQFLGNPSIWK